MQTRRAVKTLSGTTMIEPAGTVISAASARRRPSRSTQEPFCEGSGYHPGLAPRALGVDAGRGIITTTSFAGVYAGV